MLRDTDAGAGILSSSLGFVFLCFQRSRRIPASVSIRDVRHVEFSPAVLSPLPDSMEALSVRDEGRIKLMPEQQISWLRRNVHATPIHQVWGSNAKKKEAIRRETPRRAPPLDVFGAAVAAVENPAAHISGLDHCQ